MYEPRNDVMEDKSYDKEFGEYRLGFPNKEVEEGFVKFSASFYLTKQRGK